MKPETAIVLVLCLVVLFFFMFLAGVLLGNWVNEFQASERAAVAERVYEIDKAILSNETEIKHGSNSSV